MLIEYYDLMRNMWFPVHYETNAFEIMKRSIFVTSVDKLIYIVSISNLIIDLFLLYNTMMYKINCIFKQLS